MSTKNEPDELILPGSEDEAYQEEFWLEIDPSLSFDERLSRGKYNQICSDITSNNFALRVTQPVRRKIVLYDPKDYVSIEEMTRRIIENGDYCATFDDLLEFGYRFPARQLTNPIVFLLELEDYWHVPNDDCRVPYLGRYGGGGRWPGKRGLYLDWLEGLWGDYCRFAAVREEGAMGF
jgi:hypothetical protein